MKYYISFNIFINYIYILIYWGLKVEIAVFGKRRGAEETEREMDGI